MACEEFEFVRQDGLSLALVQASTTVQLLGKGGLGLVHLRQLGNRQLVVKTILLKDARTVKRAAVEAYVARQLNHPGLPIYLACFPDEEAKEVHLVMQPFTGSCTLLHVLRDKGPLPELRAAQVTQQLVAVLQHLHQEHQLVYVDLKAENVLLREVAGDCEVQLIDFDCCVSCPTASSSVNIRAMPSHLHPGLGSDDSSQDSEQPHFWGTLEYAAPEVIKCGHQAYSPASDWWSLGVLVFEMLYGFTPFQGPCQERVIYNITMRSPAFPDQPQVTDLATSFIRSLLRHKIEYRLGVQEQPLKHAWLTNASAHPTTQL